MTTNEDDLPPADGEDGEDDPNDPSHPDHDLSEAAPLWLDPAPLRPWFTRRAFLLVVAFLVIAGLMLPTLRLVF